MNSFDDLLNLEYFIMAFLEDNELAFFTKGELFSQDIPFINFDLNSQNDVSIDFFKVKPKYSSVYLIDAINQKVYSLPLIGIKEELKKIRKLK